jgi:hypothetical protein
VDHVQNVQDESLDLEGQQELQQGFLPPLQQHAHDQDEFDAPHIPHVKGLSEPYSSPLG